MFKPNAKHGPVQTKLRTLTQGTDPWEVFSWKSYFKEGVHQAWNYLSNRPQVFMVYRLKKHAGCWKNSKRIRKS